MIRKGQQNIMCTPEKISNVIMEKCHGQEVMFAPCIFYTEIISYGQFSWLKQKKTIKIASWQSSQSRQQQKWNRMIFYYESNSLTEWEVQMHWYLGAPIHMAAFRMIKNTSVKSFFEWYLQIWKSWFHKTKDHWRKGFSIYYLLAWFLNNASMCFNSLKEKKTNTKIFIP